MTEQINPTPEEETAAETPVEQSAEPAAEQPAEQAEQQSAAQEERAAAPAPKPSVSLVDRSSSRDDYDQDDEDEDDEYEDDYDEEDEDESGTRYVSGPSDYVQRERGGRGRRIGSDVRIEEIDYKNVPLLSRFLDRRGRILSRRKTKVAAKVQRRIVTEIKRARHLALLPYTADQTRIVRKRR
ncbi:MAG: 30S ribosomal protein S18 [Chloroflexota bacterium]|jgi:small subunit ribosomal protein S18|nr:30S ribosomal protein S18 [Chloroflexota bacterium]